MSEIKQMPPILVDTTANSVSVEQLRTIMPKLPITKAVEYLPFLNTAMVEFDINTPLRQSAFLAQIAHESGQLRYFEEIASGANYEGRKDLGNTQPGDGVRFKGRCPLQLTGRANYSTVGKALGVDLLNSPTLATTPELAFRIAGYFWKSQKLNELADQAKFDAITKRINGGFNGKGDRDNYYRKAKEVLGVK